MKTDGKRRIEYLAAICLAGAAALLLSSCKASREPFHNLIVNEEEKQQVVNLFSPMEKSKPDMDNTARTAFDVTVGMAEEQLGVTVHYRTYTAGDYQE